MSRSPCSVSPQLLCEKSLTFKLRGLVISGLFLECSDIQMVRVKGFGTKYWLLVASVQKYCPWQSILVDLQCVLVRVCGCGVICVTNVVWHGAGKDSFASPQWTAGRQWVIKGWIRESKWLNLNKTDTIVIAFYKATKERWRRTNTTYPQFHGITWGMTLLAHDAL